MRLYIFIGVLKRGKSIILLERGSFRVFLGVEIFREFCCSPLSGTIGEEDACFSAGDFLLSLIAKKLPAVTDIEPLSRFSNFICWIVIKK